MGRWLGRGVGGVRGWLMSDLEAVGLPWLCVSVVFLWLIVRFVCTYGDWNEGEGEGRSFVTPKVKEAGCLSLISAGKHFQIAIAILD